MNDIDNLLDSNHKEQDNNELTLYANENEIFDNIDEIKEIKNKNEIRIIKVIHSSLINLKGLPELKNLIHLDLSSNKIGSMNIYLKKLTKLKYLNLSCNLLTNVNGIENLINLEEVILSHNKINGLEGFSLLSDNIGKRKIKIPLSIIDLRDNLISSLNQIIFLENLENLNSIIFREKDGTNPICGYDNYAEFIKENLGQVKMLDNRDINSFDSSNVFQNDNENYYEPDNADNYNTNNNFLLSNFTHKNKTKKNQNTLKNFKTNTHINGLNAYKEEIKNLQYNIEELFQDQKDLIYKYEKNENYWKTKIDDLNENLKKIKDQNFSLQSIIDEREFVIREINNKLSIRENELINMRRALDEKENILSDMNIKFSLLKKDYEFSLIDNEKLLKKYSDLNKEINEVKGENIRLKEELKNEENFYKDLASKKNDELNSKIRAISNLENKVYDFSKSLSEKQKEIESLIENNNYLQSNVVKYNKIKNDNEYEINLKYEKEKEEFVKKHKSQIEELENNFKKTLNYKDEVFLKDMRIVEKSYEEIINDKDSKIELIRKENVKLNLCLNDCKELLKMSLQNEEKHEKLIKDLEKLHNEDLVGKENLGNKSEKDKENFKNKIKIMETEIKEQNEQILKMDGNLKNNKNQLREKDNEITNLYEENQKLKKDLSLLNFKIEKLEKEISNKNEEIYLLNNKMNNDVILVKIEELNEIIKTKNYMIDDQTSQILELRGIINSKESEISNCSNKTEKVKQKYDKKINQMKNDFEEINGHVENQNKAITEYEEVVNNLRNEIDNLLSDNQNLKIKINEREDITKIIQNEIYEIRDFSQISQNKINDKNNEIKNIKEVIEELNKNLVNKNRENKEILMHFENYRSEKTSEIECLIKKLGEVENDMMLVLNEYEKQKNVIKMNIQNLHNMFGV